MEDPQLPLKNNIVTIALLYLLIGSTIIIYWLGLPGVFLLDDFLHLETMNTLGGVTNKESLLQYIFSHTSGSTGRPVSMLSFLLNDQYWPSSAASFKITNILLHTLTGIFIFLLIYKISKIISTTEKDSQHIALVGTALWLLHPLNVSTTLYVIQRMTILMTLFSLISVICYIHMRETDIRIHWKKAFFLTLAFVFFGSCSVLSKENGVLLLMYIIVLEFTIFNNTPRTKLQTYWLVIFIYIPIFILIGYFISIWGTIIDNYSTRTFTLTERLLTETRILMDYLGQIILPRNAGAGLFHDNIHVSTSLLNPATTLAATISILLLLSSAYILKKRQPVYSFSIFWFFSAQILESSFIALELYFEHRNYIAMIGPLFGLAFYISRGLKIVKREFTKKLLITLPVAMIVLFGILTINSAALWGNPLKLFAIWSYENPKSIRAQLLYSRQLDAFSEHKKALNVLYKILKTYPNDVAIPLHIIDISCQNDIPIQSGITHILKVSKLSEYRGGIQSPLKSIAQQKLNGTCKQLRSFPLHKYLDELAEIPTLSKNTTVKTAILYLHADYYISQKKLSPAMNLLDKAFILQPTVDIALRQAVLLYSAGLYKDANRYLEMAIQANNKRNPFKPSRKNELDIIKKSILSNLGK